VLRFPRTTDTGPRRDVHLRTATYDGLLDVTDPDALRRTLTGGIGHGKAYGCGLLTLARHNV
jgi:CRISPR system Cascade subunit CasE